MQPITYLIYGVPVTILLTILTSIIIDFPPYLFIFLSLMYLVLIPNSLGEVLSHPEWPKQ